MKNIAFFWEKEDFSSFDYKQLLENNPGIGGSEYMMLVISCLLSLRNNGLNVKIYALKKLPNDIPFFYTVVESFDKAVLMAVNEGFECLVFKHDSSLIKKHVLEQINANIKLIPWCHLFLREEELDYYSKMSSVESLIFVGREQRDLYRDHLMFKKTLFIYNCVNVEQYLLKSKFVPFALRKPIVTYMGCITSVKGLHWLAMVWKDIIKEIPDAELYIIGSGRLYDKQQILGPYGIAEENYEKLILGYLSDDDGKLLSNVHFKGVLGKEKNEILMQTKVGVANPSGKSETFCITAVEMQLCGAKVITALTPGTLDTVKNGFLYRDTRELKDLIIKILKYNNQDDNDYMNSIEYIDKNFSINRVVERWESFFRGELQYDDKIINRYYRLKILKEVFRRVKEVKPCLYNFIPCIEKIILFVERYLSKTRVKY